MLRLISSCTVSLASRPHHRRPTASCGRSGRTVRRRYASSCFIRFTTPLIALLSAPRYQKGQGLRTSQEGQVMVGRIVSSPGFLASHFMHIRTSQKLFAAAVSYHLCPLSLFLNAHDNYAHADNASLYSDAAEPLPCRPVWRGRLEECVEDVQDSIRSAHYKSGIIAMKSIWSTDEPGQRTNRAKSTQKPSFL